MGMAGDGTRSGPALAIMENSPWLALWENKISSILFLAVTPGHVYGVAFIAMTIRTLAAVALSSLCLHHQAAADSAIEPLVGFEMGPNPNGATAPVRPALYLHSNGNFYGTTPGGGAFGFGTLFQMSKSGVFGHLSFTDLNAGSVPVGRHPGSVPTSTPVLSSDGWLWATTSAGGVNAGYGTIFRIRPETGEFQTMHNFASGTNGNSPVCGLVSDGQGYLWGMTRYTNNGTSTHGTLFRIHELTGVFEKRLTFADTVAPNKGRVPQGALYYDGAGNLWGTTSAGSSSGYGNLFKYTIATSTFTIVTEFSDRGVQAGAIKGSGAASALVPDGNGFLWGVTPYGGDSIGNGTVFKVEIATGTATSVIEFSNNGSSNKGSTPLGPLVNDGAGNLWGVASAGATSGKGSVFKIAASTGVLTTVLQFSTLTGANATVSNPINGLTNDGQGNLWGMASVGGGAATWAVYKIKISDGSFTKVADQAPGGVSYLGRTPLAGLSGNVTSPWLWGTTSAGGANNLGTLFRYDPSTGQSEVVKSFTGTTGTALGSKPNGKVYVDGDDIVWGTTEEGGTGGGIGYGTIFKYDPATSTFTTVQSFTTGGGYRPKGALVGMSDGFIWGTTSSGSSSSYGSVFKINPATNAVTVVHTFASSTPANGYQLACGLVEDTSGFVWGTTQLGGANTSGTLFKIAIATGTLTVAHSFANGSSNHAGDLVLDAADNVYGTNPLRVFKFNPNTSVLTTVFTNEDITPPLKGVTVGTLFKTLGGDIRFLGTEGTRDLTGMSPPFNNYTSYRAVIYEIDTTTNVVTKVQSLMESVVGPNVPAALTPAGSLYEHSDGSFYGVSQSGGTNEDLEPAGGGMIYRVGTGPAAIAQPYSTLVSQTYSQYSSVTGNTTLRGFVNPNGNSILCEFEWGPTTNLGNTITASATPGTGFTGNLCEAVLPGLPANTTYFFRLRANTNGLPDEPSFGPIQSIVTGTPAGPTNAEIAVESPIGQPRSDNIGTLDLGSLRVAQSVKQAVAVRNISLSNSLTGVSASITGDNASDFVITTPLTLTNVGPGGSDGLLITFTPSGSGARVATLTILSNDSDEASFEIQLTGEGLIQPEIEVDTSVATNVQSHETTYDFGTGSIGAGIARTFTIRNVGNAALSILDVSVDGVNSSEFVVTTQPDPSIAQGGSDTFVVTFTPSAGGTRTARLQIANDDSDENPFNINLTGSGILAPEIEVLDDSVELTDNASTIAFGSADIGSLSTRAITIRNAGSAALTGISLSFFSGDSTQFQYGTVASSVAAGQQITFNLSFFPLSAGAKSTVLRIASNDSNENPFDITLTGTGVAGSVNVLGITKTRLYNQTGTSTVAANNFSMSAFINGTGLNASFPSNSNRFTPSGGSATALTFDSTDSAWYQEAFFASQTLLNSTFPNGNYSFQIGSDSIALSLPSDAYPTTPVVTSDAGLWVNGRLQVTPEQAAAGFNLTTNVSNGDGFLSLEIFSDTTDVLSEFITENPQLNQRMNVDVPAGALAEGTVYTVEAEFDEVVSSQALSFTWAANTGRGFGLFSSKTAFEIEVVPAVPEIQVEHPAATPLTDGSASLAFGTLNPGTSSAAKVITIKNTGTGALTLTNVTVDGTEASDFSVNTTGTDLILSVGESTTFAITFTPGALGSRTAALHIVSDDADEGSFDINLTGTGASFPQAPLFTLQPQSRLVLLGQPVVFNTTVIGDPVMTYKWKKGTSFIKNATSSSYGIAITKAADAGAYSVIADNPVGAEVPSATAYLGLVTPNAGTQVLKVGSTLSLKSTVAKPASPRVSISYTWSRVGDTMPISGGTTVVSNNSTTGAFGITKIRTADAGTYTCLVTLDDLDTPGIDATLSHGNTVVRVVDAVPVIADLPPETVSVREPIDITVVATNFPTSFSASALPAGLAFDAKTGRLTGNPTTPSKKDTLGAYIPSKISFKATNPFGTSVAEDFYLTIEPLVPGVVGTFSGVVARSNHTNFGLGGHVKITVASTGVVTGDVTLAGQKHSLVGSIDVTLGNNPTFDLIVKRNPSSLGDLQLTGGISPEDDLLSGDISDPRFEMLTGTQDLGDPAEPGLVDGTMEQSRFSSPSSLALLANGSGYISDLGNHTIRFVDGDGGTVSTFAGSINSGSNDGTGTAASFAGPEGLALDSAGNLFVADTLNSTIRKITPAGVVTTFAGTAGQMGNVNATGTAARFERPCALCFDPAGNLYVADRGNHTIRKITPAGVVTTLAGKAGQAGHKDGSGTGALFNTPRGIVYEPVLKALFITDSENAVIRKVTLAGATTTYAGSPGVGGIADGLFANARFIDPRGITTLGDGTLIVTDSLLVQLNPNGTLGTVSDFLDTVGKLDHPVAVAYNPTDDSLITLDDVLHGAISYESSGVNQEAHFAATRNPWSAASNVPLGQQGLYNAAIETTAAPGDASYPQGSGYAQVSISKTGTANWTGKAADGTDFTFSTFLDVDRHIPLHASLYKNTGSLQGDTFINPATQDLVNHTTPAFDWYKIPQPLSSTDRSYKGGFLLHELTVTGGKYTPNDLHGYLGLSSSPAPMKLDFTASLIAAFEQSFTLTDPNTVSIATPVKSTTLKIDPKTGIFTGNFKEGTPAVIVPFAGILIDYEAGGDKSGYGHYLLPETSAANAPIRSASMTLVPNVGP